LLSGLRGRVDFVGAEKQFSKASSSNRFAQVLRIALMESDDRLFTPDEYSEFGSIFSFLRLKSDRKTSVIRLLNAHWHESSSESARVFEIWKDTALSSIHYLLDLSNADSVALRSLPTDLSGCKSILQII
jgi:hypothetical protein